MRLDSMKMIAWRRPATLLLLFCSLILPQAGWAQVQEDGVTDSGWPRQIQTDGNTITIYQPQIEQWNGNQLQSRAAVAVETTISAQPIYGVIWLSARTEVDKDRQLVTLEDCTISKGTFPTATHDYLSLIRQAIPSGPHTIALDRLQANLAVTQAEQQAQTQPLKNDPPRFFFSPTPAILALIDGPPALRQVAGTDLLRVINTRALLLLDQASGQYYLYVTDRWLRANAIEGPWTAVNTPPPSLAAAKQAAAESQQVDLLVHAGPEAKAVLQQGLVPAIYVSTTPAELIETQGKPEWTPIYGTHLLYVKNTLGTLIMNVADQEYYVLVSGRWFRSRSLDGPWGYMVATTLPTDFAKIPESHPKSSALVSIAGTPQAREAVIANSIPQTATVKRNEATLEPMYDSDPQFNPVTGTPLQYAVNSPTPVIRVDTQTYYAVENGVWFVATTPAGPWNVATSVPPVIYTIPPSSPLYYVTHVHVYGSTPDVVYVGYTPGYYGTYVAPDGVVVYGTGWEYPPYIGSVWIGPPVTYGFGAGFEWGVAAGFTLGFASDAFWSPWWRPIGWGWGWGFRRVHDGDIHHHWPLYHGNVYTRWGERAVVSHGGNAFASRGGDMRSVQNPRIGDLYAGHEGNVYRFHNGQWQRYEGSGWRPFEFHNTEQNRAQAVESSRQQAGVEGRELRGHEQIGERAGGMVGEHESVESLNREATARRLGESRWNNFRSGGDVAANHFDGRAFGGVGGAFHGGSFHGGGFGGGHR